MPAVKPLAVRLTNEGRHRAGSSGNAIASLDTLLHTLSTLTPVGGVSTAPITPSPTTTSSRFTFPVPHSPKSPATASLFVFPPLTHHHHLPGNVSITTSSITSSSGSETRRKSMHSRHSSSATIASDRSGPTMGEVGDGVWAEVAMMTPVASEPPFPLTSTHSVRHSIFEEEVVIIEDGAPSGSLTRYTFSPPPIKHNIPETVYVNANEINIDPAFILEPESPATPNTGYEEERDPPLRKESLSVMSVRRPYSAKNSPERSRDDTSSTTSPKPSVPSRKETFIQTIRNQDLYSSLKLFTSEQHCSENLAFLEHLHSIETNLKTPLSESRALDRFLGNTPDNPTISDLKPYFHLFSTFIRDGAPLEVNIPDSVRRDIRTWVHRAKSNATYESPTMLFDIAADEVVSMMYRDVFPRFLMRSQGRASQDEEELEQRGRRRAGSLGVREASKPRGRERSKSQGRFAWLSRFKE